jgi:hypothetical protein
VFETKAVETFPKESGYCAKQEIIVVTKNTDREEELQQVEPLCLTATSNKSVYYDVDNNYTFDNNANYDNYDSNAQTSQGVAGIGREERGLLYHHLQQYQHHQHEQQQFGPVDLSVSSPHCPTPTYGGTIATNHAVIEPPLPPILNCSIAASHPAVFQQSYQQQVELFKGPVVGVTSNTADAALTPPPIVVPAIIVLQQVL